MNAATSPATSVSPVGNVVPMAIAHVLETVGLQAAGPTHSVSGLCRALAQRGHDVVLHVLDRPGETPELAPAELRHHAEGLLSARLGTSAVMRDCLANEARYKQILHAHGLWRMPSVYAVRARRGTGARVVISPRGMLEPYALQHRAARKRIFWWVRQRWALEHADCLHATSEQEYTSIRRVGLKNPIAIIGNGVLSPLTSCNLPREQEVLFLARLHPIKAIDRLLRSWAGVQQDFPTWRLRIVGPDADGYLLTLKQLAHELRVERVLFEGPAFDSQKEQLFSRASLYVLPSHSENFGLTIAEALSCGLPVIASRGTPWQSLEGHGCGWWVSNDVPEFIAALKHAMGTHPAVLSEMGAKGRRWMLEEFGWGQKAEEMEAVYRWLSQKGPLPSTVQLT